MINQDQFCALANSDKFRNWLKEASPELHEDLVEYLKKGFGCKANREKMKQIFDRIRVDEEKYASLELWIKEIYPSLLNTPDPNRVLRISGSTDDIHGVFPDYDPSLQTVPRRVIISLQDAMRSRMDLVGFVASFCIRQAYCDYIVTSDRAYVEYLPPSLEKLIDKVPDKNWRIPAFRVKQLANDQIIHQK
jgi:hypothetical protein